MFVGKTMAMKNFASSSPQEYHNIAYTGNQLII